MLDAQEAVVALETGKGAFQVQINTDEHSFLMDEPAAFGGLSSGPSPFDMLGAALGACTLMTMKLYAKQKGWKLDRLSVRVIHRKGSPDARDRFERVIDLGVVTDDQRSRLLNIANRCPVHLLLERGADVSTEIAQAALAGPLGKGLHECVIRELCNEAG
ncbi:MAG TPA: OsmC family protein [Sphingomicrobium sp.]|nr:OsmC family protein [Sphingomicrobium sp.]